MFGYADKEETPYRYALSLLLLLLSLVIPVGCGGTPVVEVPTNTPAVPTDTPTPTATSTPVPTDTSTPTPTDTLTPTYTPIPTDTPTPTHTPMPTDTPVPTPTPTPLHRALLVDETFDEDILRWNWKAQDGMDGIKDGKLWLHGPPDNPERYDAFFVIPQVSVSVPGDVTIETVFDRFPKFSGIWFRVSEGWFVIVLEEDGGTGLLRPALEEAGKAWDGLGQIRRAPDGTVTLRLVFQGEKLQVWGNEL